ncbi:Ig-like domain-containing protein [Lamprobacter modestohalophilus]|uniref:Ig-like domain-containing protein n=1 Tax=Lamprobacter modestohalophilus TaxID=1064514 RepID=UPI002ADED64C|nr:Ig-like domain-containing protein [Lamprobacter modestohalophilus]MEA1048407.1 Ig-like domain-containing protein [Lamprobacter modestohalophilus]
MKHIRLFFLLMITGLTFGSLYAQTSVNPEIQMFLETPEQGAVLTGVAFIRGWAVAPTGISGVQLYVDGSYVMDIPIGESRPGVQNIYPSYPGSDKSGFNIAYQYSKLGGGAHQFTVRAIDAGGQYKDASASFTVTRFNTSNENNYIRNPNSVSLQSATVNNNGTSITVSGMTVDNTTYDVTLAWSTLLQGLAITNISTSTTTQYPLGYGHWHVNRVISNFGEGQCVIYSDLNYTDLSDGSVAATGFRVTGISPQYYELSPFYSISGYEPSPLGWRRTSTLFRVDNFDEVDMNLVFIDLDSSNITALDNFFNAMELGSILYYRYSVFTTGFPAIESELSLQGFEAARRAFYQCLNEININ